MYKELLRNHPPGLTPFGEFPFKPTRQFARASICVSCVRVIETNICFYHLNPFDLVKAIVNIDGFSREYVMLLVLLRH
jgi:hypothetical protein